MYNRLKRLNDALPGLLAGILIYGGLVELIGIWFVSDKLRYTTGLIIGLGCAVGCGIHLAMIIEEAVRIGESNSKLLAVKSGLRVVVVFLVLCIMMKFNLGSLIPACLGILGLKASAYAQPLLNKMFKRDCIEQGGGQTKTKNK